MLLVLGIALHTRKKKYVGFGFKFSYDFDSKIILIPKCHPDSPAHRAGVRDGAVLVAVDGKGLSAMSYPQYFAWTRDTKPALGEERTFLIREGTVARSITLKAEVLRAYRVATPDPPRYEASERELREMYNEGMVSRQVGDKVIIAPVRTLRRDVVERL